MDGYSNHIEEFCFFSIELIILLIFVLICFLFKEYLEWILSIVIIIGIFGYLLIAGAGVNK